jgi:hypothetical protein
MINFLKHKQIDKKRWDGCILNSVNGLVYAQSWYLDIVSPGWEALIEDDYKSAMPLPAKCKYMIPYLIQPRYTQQLGIFSNNPISPEKVKSFLHRIPRKFVWCDFNLNSHNPVNNLTGILNRYNYELNLATDYQEIYKGYNENTRRNIKKSLQAGTTFEVENEPDVFYELFKTNTKLNLPDIALAQLKSITEYSISNNYGEIVFTHNTNGQVIAGAFFLKAFGKIIYLISFTSDEGQQNSAMFQIIDEMIKKYASQPFIFDFEGSMIPGIARFFAGFGAEKTTYPSYQHSIIPFV